MFSRNRSAAPASPSDAPDPVQAAAEIERGNGKGRPTPRRKVAEAANKRPLVPNDRRAAAKAAREKQREARDRQYQAMQTGDERYLPPRDKGPVKRYVRDYVDARWNLGEFFLPVALVFIVLSLFTASNTDLAFVTVMALYAIVLLTVVDAFVMWRRLRKRIVAKFGEVPRGTVMYAVMRAFQLRRARLPKPAHKKHGVYPD
ncbi:DUF3043 domain-containing protein [Cellulosimicrobium sp. CUA-896]|uniref:DUF3043 domain-containing protein n=1 Tax=Cellulosimicrobium sp. CUA-896 TaxID=1517881 RepID=UPI000960FE6A|nr:DUF3043 domain-containing protein [Cellulosimicrobium sp. CUA-896]OLT54080.1 hypothetical protein BJF88_00890 [Cellulosimicrobium sp. CUA-896]